MLGKPLEDAKGAALAFLDNLAPGDEVALIDFDSTVKLAQPFTTDLDAVRAAIDGLVADGGTALYDAAYTAAEVAAGPTPPVVFLTDGNEWRPERTSAGADANEQNIQFYTFGQPRPPAGAGGPCCTTSGRWPRTASPSRTQYGAPAPT